MPKLEDTDSRDVWNACSYRHQWSRTEPAGWMLGQFITNHRGSSWIDSRMVGGTEGEVKYFIL